MARLRVPELADKANRPGSGPAGGIVAGFGWAASGAFVGAAAWWVGGIAARRLLDVVLPEETTNGWQTLAVLLAVAGVACGTLIGGVTCLMRERMTLGTTVVRCGLGAVIGTLGGGLPPLTASAAAGVLDGESSLILAGALVGMCAGGLAYTFGRDGASPEGTFEESEKLIHRTVNDAGRAARRRPAESYHPFPHWGGGRGVGSETRRADAAPLAAVAEVMRVTLDSDAAPSNAPRPAQREWKVGVVVRVLPVGIVSAACLAAALFTTPSPVGWAILAVGLLGAGMVWALAGQERRIRSLERRLEK